MREPRRQGQETISDRIVALRMDSQLSQSAFAKRVGIDQRKVSRMESDPNRIDHYVVTKLADIFHVRHEWLLTGALPKEKDTNEIVASDDRIDSLEKQIEALRVALEAKDQALNLALEKVQLLEKIYGQNERKE